MSLFANVWAWLKKEFTHITVDIAKIAVAVTEQIKAVVENPGTAVVATILDELQFHGLASEVLGTIKNSIIKVLAFELSVELPSGDITSEEFLAWEAGVIKALGIHADTSAIWTKVSTAIVRDYQAFTQDGSAVTFFEGAQMVQDAYLAYQEAKNGAQ